MLKATSHSGFLETSFRRCFVCVEAWGLDDLVLSEVEKETK